MASEWTTFRLEQVCSKIGSGATPRGGSSVYLDQGEVALIRSQNIYNDGFQYNGLTYITSKHAEQLANVEVMQNDVLLNITGDSVARACHVKPDVLPARVNQHVAIIRTDENQLWPRYLRYFLISPSMQSHMLQLSSAGATRNALTKGMIESFDVPAPIDVKEQQAIACILGALDDKIESNRKLNQTLEEMAMAIFKSWFVDFDPVRAKAAGQQPLGLKPEIVDLFPDSLEDSELGKIPKGWKARPIGEMVQVLGGGTPSTKDASFWEGGIHPFCTPKDMAPLTAPVLLQTERHLTDKGLAKVSSGKLPIGTVLLSSRAPIGYLAIAETPVSVNQGIIAMVCDRELPNLYVLHWTSTNMDRIIAKANGSTFLEISKQNFRPILAILPTQDILHQFTQVVDPMYHRVVSSLSQIQHLVAVRDSLLPKLISGELQIPDAERIVGRYTDSIGVI